MRQLEIKELQMLIAAPFVGVLQPDVTAALELWDALDIFATDLVDGLVDQFHDVELVEGNRSPGQMLLEPGR
jgi:hypothetical protein